MVFYSTLDPSSDRDRMGSVAFDCGSIFLFLIEELFLAVKMTAFVHYECEVRGGGGGVEQPSEKGGQGTD